MRLTEVQQDIINGNKGRLLTEALINLVKYGTAMGAEEFIPITSAHIAFSAMDVVALCFSPRGRELTKAEIDRITEEMRNIKVNVRTTVNSGIIDRRRWQQMGADESIYNSVVQAVEVARECGIMPTFSITPHLTDNIPLMGEHCAWAESGTHLYINSILGARSNRESYESAFYSCLLGITPNFGMHLNENRKGTDLVDIQCELEYGSDWGALGYFTGDSIGIGIPVFKNLKRPVVEQVNQLCFATNSPGAIPMLLIPGVSPEAPTLEAAFRGNKPRNTYFFDDKAKQRIYNSLNYNSKGEVDLISFRCPTLYELSKIAKMIEGKKVHKNTRLWIMTSDSIRHSAEQIGYAQIIEDSGAELFADGTLLIFYINAPAKKPKMNRIATNSAKLAFAARRSFHNNIFFGSTERCIEIAIKGGV